MDLAQVLAVVATLLAIVATAIAGKRGLRGSPVFAGWVLALAHPGWWGGAMGLEARHQLTTAAGFTVGVVGVMIWASFRPHHPRVAAPDPEDG